MSQCINVMCDNVTEDGGLCADCLLTAAKKAGQAGESTPEDDQLDAPKETRPDLNTQEAGQVAENTGLVDDDKDSKQAKTTQENKTKTSKPTKTVETNGQGRKHKDIDIIEQPRLDDLPLGVTHPQGQRNERTRDMKPADLQRRISLAASATWIQSPEYAEQIFRLQTLTLDKLEESGQHIPQWRKVLG